MSTDIKARRPPCGECGIVFQREIVDNITWNLTPMIERVLGEVTGLVGREFGESSASDWTFGWYRFNGHSPRVMLSVMKEALPRLTDPARRAEFVALEPPNKWGTHADLCEVWVEMIGRLEELDESYIIEVS